MSRLPSTYMWKDGFIPHALMWEWVPTGSRAPTSSAILHHAWRSPRCIYLYIYIYFPSVLKTVQINKNTNSTNISKLSAWHSLSYSREELGILWACESYRGWKSLKNTKKHMFGCKRPPCHTRLLLGFGLGKVLKFILLLPPSLLA